MCGRYVAAAAPDELANYFGAGTPDTLLPENHNVAPTNDVYAVVDESDQKQRKLETFHWGLVPSWAKERKGSSRMINARAETVATRNSYRKPFRVRRCIIPADGFYEWKVVGKDERGRPTKQPYYIYRVDGEPLAFAGIWDRWWGPPAERDQRPDDAEALHSTTIITTSANEFMSSIHDRMPVMLPANRWDEWLDPDNEDVDSLQKLLVPAPEGLLAAHPVDKKVGNVRNKGAELIEPIVAESA